MLPSAIIFDMDGLMVDSEGLAIEAWQEAARREGAEISRSLCIDMIGLNQCDSERLLVERLGAGFPLEQVRDHFFRGLKSKLDAGRIEAKTGLHALLDYLDEKDVAKAVATSASRDEALLKLEAVDVLHRFSVIVTTDEVERGKPAPDLFLLAATRLAIAPERCTVLEDSEAGVRAAHAAGMRPIMVPDIKPPSEATLRLAARICASLGEVRQFLADEDEQEGAAVEENAGAAEGEAHDDRRAVRN